MKNFIKICFSLAIIAMTVFYCKKETSKNSDNPDIPDISDLFTISNATAISSTTATFNITVSTDFSVTDKGVFYSQQRILPDSTDYRISKGAGVGSFTVILNDLFECSYYYVRPYVVINEKIYYGPSKALKTLCQEDIDGVLIQGIRWATRNVDVPGRFTATPETAGMFYQWNRKIGWSSVDPLENSEGGTEWKTSIPDGDKWEEVNDPCPSGWRIPTWPELKELLDAEYYADKLNDVKGIYVGSKKDHIFFPFAKSRYFEDGSLPVEVLDYGMYWSSTQSPDLVDMAFGLGFNPELGIAIREKTDGVSVRCVKN